MYVALEVRVGDVAREHLRQRVFLEHHLRYREVYRLGVVARVAVFLVLVEHHRLEVVDGKPYARVVGELRVEAALEELDVDHFADYRGRHLRAPVFEQIFLDFERDALSRRGVYASLDHQRVADAARVPRRALFLCESVYHQREVGRFAVPRDPYPLRCASLSSKSRAISCVKFDTSVNSL